MTSAPTDSLEGLIDALADVARRHRNLTLRVYRESGLPTAQMAVLSVLARLGESRMADLAEELLVDPSVVSRHVSQLEQSDNVERRSDPADGRASLIRITARGEETLAEVRRLRRHHLQNALTGWSEAEVAELTGTLGTVSRFLDAAQAAVR